MTLSYEMIISDHNFSILYRTQRNFVFNLHHLITRILLKQKMRRMVKKNVKEKRNKKICISRDTEFYANCSSKRLDFLPYKGLILLALLSISYLKLEVLDFFFTHNITIHRDNYTFHIIMDYNGLDLDYKSVIIFSCPFRSDF